jgi:very-short-patch-repair endonuclease
LSEEISQEEMKRLLSLGKPKKASQPSRTPKRRKITGNSAHDYKHFAQYLKTCPGIPPNFIAEYPFGKAIGRKNRADFAWPEYRLALEIDGGIFIGKGHGSAVGIWKDQEKGNLYAFLRWHLLRITPDDIQSGYAVSLLQAWFSQQDYPQRKRSIRRNSWKKRRR